MMDRESNEKEAERQREIMTWIHLGEEASKAQRNEELYMGARPYETN